MKVQLKKPVIGCQKISEGVVERTHADEGDVLDVILHNKTHYICDSKHFPGWHIAVFPSQCLDTIEDLVIEDEHADEKYYHVYEKPSKKNLVDDPFYTAFEFDDTREGILE
jgi:hypothetical protein